MTTVKGLDLGRCRCSVSNHPTVYPRSSAGRPGGQVTYNVVSKERGLYYCGLVLLSVPKKEEKTMKILLKFPKELVAECALPTSWGSFRSVNNV